MLGRQMGKTTVAAGYLLWFAMFKPDSTILVAAHKAAGAQEIMQRIRYAYESIPNHIRAGVVEYNKGSITFDNGSYNIIPKYFCKKSMDFCNKSMISRFLLQANDFWKESMQLGTLDS